MKMRLFGLRFRNWDNHGVAPEHACVISFTGGDCFRAYAEVGYVCSAASAPITLRLC